MPVPIVFRKSQNNIIPSYTAFDIANAQGLITLYGAKDQSGATLVTEQIYSDPIATKETLTTTYTKEIDIDFDLTVNKPIVVDGLANVSIPFFLGSTAGTSETLNCYAIVYFRKWDGTTETDLATNTSNTAQTNLSSGTLTPLNDYYLNVSFDIPKTLFTVGQTLRLTVEMWAKSTGGSNQYVTLPHDPQNRTSTVINNLLSSGQRTELVFQMPTRIDL